RLARPSLARLARLSLARRARLSLARLARLSLARLARLSLARLARLSLARLARLSLAWLARRVRPRHRLRGRPDRGRGPRTAQEQLRAIATGRVLGERRDGERGSTDLERALDRGICDRLRARHIDRAPRGRRDRRLHARDLPIDPHRAGRLRTPERA